MSELTAGFQSLPPEYQRVLLLAQNQHRISGAPFRSSLVMFRRLGNRRGVAECMAGLKARQGNAQWGAVMLSAAEAALKVTGGAWWPADRLEVEANQELI